MRPPGGRFGVHCGTRPTAARSEAVDDGHRPAAMTDGVVISSGVSGSTFAK
jgi:hypothetical protein